MAASLKNVKQAARAEQQGAQAIPFSGMATPQLRTMTNFNDYTVSTSSSGPSTSYTASALR